MRYQIKTDDQLILRDGKPFGDDGAFGGNAVNWVMPQTLAGMVRTGIGFTRDENYFDSPDNQKAILEVGVEKILNTAIVEGKEVSLAPLLADLVFTADSDIFKLNVNLLEFSVLPNGWGTDIKNPDWMLPILKKIEKPAKHNISQLLWHFFEKYLKGELKTNTDLKTADIGLGPIISKERIHNGIKPDSFTTEDGKLFSNKGLYFTANYQDGDRNMKIPLGICYTISGLKPNEKLPSNSFFLGGERKTVFASEIKNNFPDKVADFANQKFLKLILMTHGSFGQWCPEWLRPDLNANSIPYRNIPNTNLRIRLRSACINGWEGISGWDYSSKGKIVSGKKSNGVPKAMRKLVKPGAIYLIEVENPAQSNEIANHFWGSSICNEPEMKEGYGLVVVGSAENQINKN